MQQGQTLDARNPKERVVLTLRHPGWKLALGMSEPISDSGD